MIQQTMGKVVAERYADLAFETALPIERVLVKNGQQVHKGQVLAQLDLYKLRTAIAQQERAIEQAQLQIEQAYLQMQDVIIAQGYDPDKKDNVPANVMHNADVKSGYALSKSQLASAKTQLAAAQHELRSGVLTAPFDGVIANVSVQAHQLAQAGQPVCRVIASGNMNVEFRVMEADLAKYKLGTAVSVIPVADQSRRYDAAVSEINPIVDEQGAVTLRARLTNGTNLYDGMNVIIIEN
jgi:RND family efflux transporter MFP subunit